MRIESQTNRKGEREREKKTRSFQKSGSSGVQHSQRIIRRAAILRTFPDAPRHFSFISAPLDVHIPLALASYRPLDPVRFLLTAPKCADSGSPSETQAREAVRRVSRFVSQRDSNKGSRTPRADSSGTDVFVLTIAISRTRRRRSTWTRRRWNRRSAAISVNLLSRSLPVSLFHSLTLSRSLPVSSSCAPSLSSAR